MTELPQPWAHYLDFQTKLSQTNRVDDSSWELEEALTFITKNPDQATLPNITRASQRRGRRERYQKQLRLIRLTHLNETLDVEVQLQARQTLRVVRQRVTDEEWDILCRLSDGDQYGDIVPSARAGVVRIRVMRIRRRLEIALSA
jgi:hypothetical protein